MSSRSSADNRYSGAIRVWSSALLIAATAFALDARAILHHCSDKTYAVAEPHAMALFHDARDDMKAKRFARALRKLQDAYCDFPAPALLRFVAEAQLELGRCEAAGKSVDEWEQHAADFEKPVIADWRSQMHARCIPVTFKIQPAEVSVTLDGDSLRIEAGKWVGPLSIGTHTFHGSGKGLAARDLQVTVTADTTSIGMMLVPADSDGSAAAH